MGKFFYQIRFKPKRIYKYNYRRRKEWIIGVIVIAVTMNMNMIMIISIIIVLILTAQAESTNNNNIIINHLSSFASLVFAHDHMGKIDIFFNYNKIWSRLGRFLKRSKKKIPPNDAGSKFNACLIYAKTACHESSHTISSSGFQRCLQRMFNLCMESEHLPP